MRTERRARGFTIVELTVSLAALAFLTALACGYVQHLHERRSAAEGCASDLRQVRAALQHLERDLRGARSVASEDERGALVIDEGEILYRCGEGGLVRIASGAQQGWRSVAALRARRTGDLVRVELELRRRSRPETAAAMALHTAVHIRREAP